jgi:hypothetical protein
VEEEGLKMFWLKNVVKRMKEEEDKCKEGEEEK